MISRRLLLAAVLGIATVCIPACSDARKKEAEAAVRAYNDALIIAYRTSDPSAVKEVVTSKELRKLTALIDLKRAASLVLESTLEQLEVTSVAEPSPGIMVVQTEERWRYFDRPLKPGVPSGQEFVARMRLEYSFIADGGSWRMDQARTLQNEYLEPPGYRPDQHQRRRPSLEGQTS